MSRIVIIGGGPAGYEAALVAAQLGAQVTVVERAGFGGACVLYDCVPSKTFIAAAETATTIRTARQLGVRCGDSAELSIDVPLLHGRVKALAEAQSEDIHDRLVREGVTVVAGTARFAEHQQTRGLHTIEVAPAEGGPGQLVDAELVLLATGSSPRVLPDAQPDGERILTWRQVYDLPALPSHLIVIGSGVTGAEFASAYRALGVPVTLVSSRDRVLPGEDPDAAAVLEQVFAAQGMEIVKPARALAVRRAGSGVVVELEDGRVVEGSHALLTVGSTPNTGGLGLEHVGVGLNADGYIAVDRVSRTTVAGVYAAGDCTGMLALASVAAMQGRIAMWHALGEAVAPLRLKTVAATVFTHPEIATVGIQQAAIDAGVVPARVVTLPLDTNARAKMQGVRDGFVKLFCRPATGVVIGGVVVAPYASELILLVAAAVQHQLTVDQLAGTFAVYPSMSGSLTEAARRLMVHGDLD
ncbi:MAG: NAD(P)H-quinone dehydrogenase [Actinobacteria bacterium]|nr:NAD(P)H-quinone dehydrogenase [Actinomycetota bacterium]MBI3687890.1 NAD(P)H-quinone dehydrogenase [Actinomycetota bacterium]